MSPPLHPAGAAAGEGDREDGPPVASAGRSPSPGSTSAPAALPPLLAFVAGAVDTTGFIVFAGLFLAHVTGNFVLLGAAIGEPVPMGTLMRVLVLPFFVGGVALAWWMLRVAGARGPMLLALAEAFLLAVCGALAVAPGWESLGRDVAIGCGVGAMGIQAMLGRAIKAPMTNVMTGNVTQLTVDVLEFRRAGGRRSPVVAGVLLVVAFGCGALAAGLAVPRLGLVFMFLPAGCMVAAAWALHRPSGRVGVPGGADSSASASRQR